jgi:pyruvate dehydrogenase E1 component alpha subunit
MEKTVKNFSVKYLQILNERGEVDEKLMPKISDGEIKRMYDYMLLTRVFDDYAVKYQRQGRMGTYASVLGEEACQIGSAILMKKDDLAFPSFREHGVFITRDMPLEALFSFWIGDERGMSLPDNGDLFPVSIPVGSHPLHAVGAGMAFNYQKKKRVSLAYFGDGATSEGDFHEAMNFACVFKAPCVFICQNNQYAISVPVSEQTCAATLAQKAIAYGFEGRQVDGNDVFAVYSATKDALKKARSGGGPTFIECLTYRMGDHTTSDDALKYRSTVERKEWSKKGPLIRLKKYMLKKKLLSQGHEKKLLEIYEKKVSAAFKKAEAAPGYKAEEIFDFMYANLTPALEEQRKSLEGG